jgi:hypothetical protein
MARVRAHAEEVRSNADRAARDAATAPRAGAAELEKEEAEWGRLPRVLEGVRCPVRLGGWVAEAFAGERCSRYFGCRTVLTLAAGCCLSGCRPPEARMVP